MSESIRSTRFHELGYCYDGEFWRFVEISTCCNIGPQYRTKTELFADMQRFAEQFGCK